MSIWNLGSGGAGKAKKALQGRAAQLEKAISGTDTAKKKQMKKKATVVKKKK